MPRCVSRTSERQTQSPHDKMVRNPVQNHPQNVNYGTRAEGDAHATSRVRRLYGITSITPNTPAVARSNAI